MQILLAFSVYLYYVNSNVIGFDNMDQDLSKWNFMGTGGFSVVNDPRYCISGKCIRIVGGSGGNGNQIITKTFDVGGYYDIYFSVYTSVFSVDYRETTAIQYGCDNNSFIGTIYQSKDVFNKSNVIHVDYDNVLCNDALDSLTIQFICENCRGAYDFYYIDTLVLYGSTLSPSVTPTIEPTFAPTIQSSNKNQTNIKIIFIMAIASIILPLIIYCCLIQICKKNRGRNSSSSLTQEAQMHRIRSTSSIENDTIIAEEWQQNHLDIAQITVGNISTTNFQTNGNNETINEQIITDQIIATEVSKNDYDLHDITSGGITDIDDWQTKGKSSQAVIVYNDIPKVISFKDYNELLSNISQVFNIDTITSLQYKPDFSDYFISIENNHDLNECLKQNKINIIVNKSPIDHESNDEGIQSINVQNNVITPTG